MNSEDTTKNVDLRPVTKIIASYVGHHTLAPDQLSALIISVQQALDLGKPTPLPVPHTGGAGQAVVQLTTSSASNAVQGKRCKTSRHARTATAEYLRRYRGAVIIRSPHRLFQQRSTMARSSDSPEAQPPRAEPPRQDVIPGPPSSHSLLVHRPKAATQAV
jgi:hypothetical protein